VWAHQEVASLYSGALYLILCPLAIVLRPRRRTFFFAAVLVISLALETHESNAVRQLAVGVLPGFSSIAAHIPERLLFVTMFAVVVLGASSFQYTPRRDTTVSLPIFIIVLVVSVGSIALVRMLGKDILELLGSTS